MKPYLTVKTVKNRKYVQISDTRGDLIHIGPASKSGTWSVAFKALQDAYAAFSLEELLAFREVIEEAGIDLEAAIDRSASRKSEMWMTHREKVIKKRLAESAAWGIARGYSAAQILEESLELEGHLRSLEKTGLYLDKSPRYLEILFNFLESRD